VLWLRAHKVKLLELRLVLGLGAIKPDTLVFGNGDDGLLRPRNLSKAWWRLSTAAKLPRVRFHSLRHTHVSVLIRGALTC
jgi:integrase